MEPWPTVVFPKQAGGIVRAGRATAQPVLPLGVITRQFVSYRRKSAKLRRAGRAVPTRLITVDLAAVCYSVDIIYNIIQIRL